jgi:hypothetical protein
VRKSRADLFYNMLRNDLDETWDLSCDSSYPNEGRPCRIIRPILRLQECSTETQASEVYSMYKYRDPLHKDGIQLLFMFPDAQSISSAHPDHDD